MTRRRLALLLLLPGWLSLLVGFGAIASGFYTLTSELAFALRAELARGTVTEIRTVEGRRSTVHVAEIRFVTRTGETVRTDGANADGWLRHAPGDEVLVRYDPAAPDRATTDHLVLRLLGSLMALPLGGVLIALGWPLVAPPYARPRAPVVLLRGAGASLVLLLAASVAANEVNEARASLRGTALAQGEVIGHRTLARGPGDGRSEPLHAPVIRFVTAEGRPVVAAPHAWSHAAEPSAGTRLTIRYRIDEPEWAEPHDPLAIWMRPAVATAVLLVLLGVGLALLRRRFRAVHLPRRA